MVHNLSFKNRKPSLREKRKEAIEDKIIDIYDESHQNYGAPKITLLLLLILFGVQI